MSGTKGHSGIYDRTIEMKMNISKALKGRHWTTSEFKAHKGKHKISRRGRENISKALMGNKHFKGHHFHHSSETREKMSKDRKGKPNGKLGILWTDEGKRKRCGKGNPNWKGGISGFPYPFNFNRELKKFIRKRDNYMCQKCGIKQNGKAHCVHHIDYDKENLDPNNLVTLCRSCNGKVNSRRNYWQEYFRIFGRHFQVWIK